MSDTQLVSTTVGFVLIAITLIIQFFVSTFDSERPEISGDRAAWNWIVLLMIFCVSICMLTTCGSELK